MSAAPYQYYGNANPGYYDPYDEPRQARRVVMACQFCRARKLKCDGLRPQCTNCSKRSIACNYVPVGAKETGHH